MTEIEIDRLKKELRETKQVLHDLLQERGSNADGVIKAIEEGATPDNLRTLGIIHSTDEDAKRKLADAILYRVYRGWIHATSDDLVRCVIDGECEDYESLRERLEQDCDSALIYTHDQNMVIYAADGSSTQAGAAEAEEMGGSREGGGPDSGLPIWALLTYQHDVWDRLDSMGLNGDFDRGAWLEAAQAGEFDGFDETLSARAARAR